MTHLTRTSALLTIFGLALYVTSLQDKVVDPVVEFVGYLGLLVALVVGVWGLVIWQSGRQRAELRRARAAVDAASSVR